MGCIERGCISRLNRREWIETRMRAAAAGVKPVSPGLIAGSGLKLDKRAGDNGLASGISRLNRREWIETALARKSLAFCRVSPGLIAGSGLKRDEEQGRGRQRKVSPGLIAGSGLKQLVEARLIPLGDRISRLNRREWIETCVAELKRATAEEYLPA